MSWKISFFCFSLALFSCTTGNRENAQSLENTSEVHQTKYLIEAEELLLTLNSTNITVIDFRRKSSYEQGHISGAINFWRSDIEDHQQPYSGMRTSAEQLEILFSKKGIENDDLLIVYDDVGSCDAARLWWVLQSYSFENLKILNGGFDAWKRIDGSIETEETKPVSSKFTLPQIQKREVGISGSELKNKIAKQETLFILDTRSSDEFTGRRQKKGAIAAGRIPTSIHFDWVENINYDGDKRFNSLDTLAERYKNLGLSEDQLIVTYCHTGVRSALTYFVLTELLAYKNVRNYDGSWVEWSHMGFPVQQDSITVISK